VSGASQTSFEPSLGKLLAGSVLDACAGLVGCVIARRLPGADGGKPITHRALIVETEAYHMREPGCHAYRGMTPRNAVMFGPAGRLYVYFTYGMWHCANVVCEKPGVAAAVLLRAAAPLPPWGEDAGADSPRLSGPGLLCRALGLTRAQSGADLLSRRGDVWLFRPTGYTPPLLTWTKRIGLGFEDSLLWRCFWTGHPAVSPGRPGPVATRRRG